jgi:hypothetical protein
MLASAVPTPGRYPKGPNTALQWPDGFELSYWDLWFLLTLKEKLKFEFALLENFLQSHLRPDSRTSNSEEWFKKLCHWEDLKTRVPDSSRAVTLLAQSPEKLIKKETKKGIDRITSAYISDELSPAMQSNPRNTLRKQALKGLFSQYPVDPINVYERNTYEFCLPGERGYFGLDSTFRLSRDVERAYEDEMNSTATAAERLAVTRAFIALMLRNAHTWNDSCGAMSETFDEFYKDWLKTDLTTSGLSKGVFFQDLLWNYIFDDYCLCSSNHRILTSHLQTLDEATKLMIREQMTDLKSQLEKVHDWYNASKVREFDRALNGITDKYYSGDEHES